MERMRQGPEPRKDGKLRQTLQVFVIPLLGVPSNDPTNRRVRRQRRHIDSQGLTLQQLGILQAPQHPLEHRLMGLKIDPTPRLRHRGVIPRPPIRPIPRNRRRLSESPTLQAIRRSDSKHPKSPTKSIRKYRPGARLGRPTPVA